MKHYKTKDEAEVIAEYYDYLHGQPLPEPYLFLSIDSITIEKARNHQGFQIILAHDIFDGGIPELTNNKYPVIELSSYLKIMG